MLDVEKQHVYRIITDAPVNSDYIGIGLDEDSISGKMSFKY